LSTKKKPVPKIVITKHPEFRIAHINGIFGTLTPLEGRISFYTDMMEPRIKEGGNFGEMETNKVNREIQFEIRLSPLDFVGIADWMALNVKRLEESGTLKKEDIAKSKQADSYLS